MTTSFDIHSGISQCILCEQEVPRVLLGSGPDSRLWECRSCGAGFEGVLADDANMELRSRIVVTDYFPTVPRVPKPGGKPNKGRDRRRHARRPITIEVPVVRLNAEMLPIGETFTMVSRDLSESGIGLFHSWPVKGHIAIRVALTEGPVELTARVVRCKPIGELYHIAAEFIERI